MPPGSSEEVLVQYSQDGGIMQISDCGKSVDPQRGTINSPTTATIHDPCPHSHLRHPPLPSHRQCHHLLLQQQPTPMLLTMMKSSRLRLATITRQEQREGQPSPNDNDHDDADDDRLSNSSNNNYNRGKEQSQHCSWFQSLRCGDGQGCISIVQEPVLRVFLRFNSRKRNCGSLAGCGKQSEYSVFG